MLAVVLCCQQQQQREHGILGLYRFYFTVEKKNKKPKTKNDSVWRWHDLKARSPVRGHTVTQAELTGVKVGAEGWGLGEVTTPPPRVKNGSLIV